MPANPVNAAAMHLRRGLRVLWVDDRGHYLLAKVEAVGASDPTGRRSPLARLRFPNGQGIVTSIDRLYPLPRHDAPRYFRRTPRPIPIPL